MKPIKILRKVIFFTLLVGLAAGVMLPSPAALAWPTKNITFIVPYNPGGGYDLQARILAPFLERYLPGKVNVIIKNVSGASGKIGVLEIARSKPDGYTIGNIGRESIAFSRAMGDIDLDIREWSWLGQLSSDPLLLAVPMAGKYKKPADMKGQDVRFGVSNETLPAAVITGQTLGANARPILFNGSGDAILACMRGDVDANIFSFPSMWKGIRDSSGKLTAMCNLTTNKIPEAKDIPILENMGFQLTDAAKAVLAASRVVFGPPGLDKQARESLETAMAKAMQDPEYLQNMEKAKQYADYENGAAVKANIILAVDAYTSVKDKIEPFLKRK